MNKYRVQILISLPSASSTLSERFSKTFYAKDGKTAGQLAIANFKQTLPFFISGETIEVESVTQLQPATAPTASAEGI